MDINEYNLKQKIERPGREIKIDEKPIKNKNITVRIGTTDNKNHPNTVYVSITFWVDIKNRKSHSEYNDFDDFISKKYKREIQKIKTEILKDRLTSNKFSPFYYDNIFTCDFPENLNYNNKKSFTTIELILHTSNCNKTEDYISLKNKPECKLLNELIKISNIIGSTDLLKGKMDFKIFKTKK